jgi:ATP-binding cassette subfamily B protein
MKGKRMNLDRATNPKLAVKKLFDFMSPYRKLIFVVIAFAIGSTIFAIVGPKILGNATTELFEGVMRKLSGSGGINFTKIRNIIIFLLAIYKNKIKILTNVMNIF